MTCKLSADNKENYPGPDRGLHTPRSVGGPGLRGAQNGPGAYESRARCTWGKKGKKEEKKGKKKKEIEKKGKKKKTWGLY